MSDDDNILSRWSKRKRAVAREATPEEALEEENAPPKAPAEATEEEDEATILARLNLPAPETLGEGDDFTPFMQPAVPEFLRRRALRVLWRSNPVLANIDGLNDYDEDFTSPELTQKVLATSYKVGKGIVREILAPEAEDADAGPGEVEEVEKDSQDGVEQEKTTPETIAATPPTTGDEDEPTFRPRRMTFKT